MDKNVGVLRRSLKSLGIAENTLVIFLSDNGPENGAGSAGQLRGVYILLFIFCRHF